MEQAEATDVELEILRRVQRILQRLLPGGELDAWLHRAGLAGAMGQLKCEVERMETVVSGVKGRAVGNKPLARCLARVKELMSDAGDVVGELDYCRRQQQVEGVNLAPGIEPEGMIHGDGGATDGSEQANASAGSTAGISDNNCRKNRSKERDYFHITPAVNGEPARAKCIDCGTQVVFSHGTSVLRKHRNSASCKKKRAATEETPNRPSAGDGVQNRAAVSANDSEGRKRTGIEGNVATVTPHWDHAKFSKRIDEITRELGTARVSAIDYLKDSVAAAVVQPQPSADAARQQEERLVQRLMQHQESLHRQFVEAMERRERERAERDEAWRRQEADKFAREAHLQKISGGSTTFPPPPPAATASGDDTSQDARAAGKELVVYGDGDGVDAAAPEGSLLQLSTSRWPKESGKKRPAHPPFEQHLEFRVSPYFDELCSRLSGHHSAAWAARERDGEANAGASGGGKAKEASSELLDRQFVEGMERRERSRKSQTKKVVCIPAPSMPLDVWAWRKCGQKPIKGSPYPRDYYRCSSSKGCSARKQVERSRTDPSMVVITYTSEHNHPWPMLRRSGADKFAREADLQKISGESITLPLPPPPPPPAATASGDDTSQEVVVYGDGGGDAAAAPEGSLLHLGMCTEGPAHPPFEHTPSVPKCLSLALPEKRMPAIIY